MAVIAAMDNGSIDQSPIFIAFGDELLPLK